MQNLDLAVTWHVIMCNKRESRYELDEPPRDIHTQETKKYSHKKNLETKLILCTL